MADRAGLGCLCLDAASCVTGRDVSANRGNGRWVMNPIGVMFKLTLREAARRKVLWGLLILSVLFLLLYAVGLGFIQSEIARFGVRPSAARNGLDLKTGYSFLATFALYAANFLIVLLAVLIPMDTLAGEIGSGTIQSLAVKPLR